MGLDGISVNQLRITPEFNSAELNKHQSINSEEIKIVDGLSNGQRIDPDKERDSQQSEAQSQQKEESKEEENIQEEVTKYDLSDSNKYVVKLDDVTNQILIIEKATNKVVQNVDADQLSKLVAYSQNTCGSIVNRKF